MNRETLPTKEKMRSAANKNAADRNTYEDQNRKTTQEDQETRISRKEWLIQEAKKFNLLSNVFMSVVLDDKEACQHVIRVITGIGDLVVKEVRSQYRISKITSHDAILDILAEDGKGQLYNLEIQRKDTVDHARRTRFYTAMIDSGYLLKGQEYSEMPEVHIIYISETDVWKAGKTVYEVEKRLKDTEMEYDDGVHIIYVNAAVDDGSDIAKLMKYFKTADPQDMSQGSLSRRVHQLKCEEGDSDLMCEISEKIYNEGRMEGRKEGRKEGEMNAKRETAINMKKKGYSDTTIADLLEVGANMVQQWLSGTNPAKP